MGGAWDNVGRIIWEGHRDRVRGDGVLCGRDHVAYEGCSVGGA